jgi:hypothetical protein
MRDAGLELALPPGTITREARKGETTEETTIDLVWMSSKLLEGMVQCRVARELEQSSDHLPIVTWIEIEDAIETHAKRERRAWKKTNWEKFDKALEEGLNPLRQSQIDTKDQIYQYVDSATQAINEAIASSTPWAKTTEFSKTWWTSECRKAVNDARKARRAYTKYQTTEAWEEYVHTKNRKGKIIAKAKRDDFRQHMHQAGQSQEGLWRIARWASQRAKGATQHVSIPTLKRGEREAHDPHSKAEMLKDVHFPPPVEADLTDANEYPYPEGVSMPNQLTKEEVMAAITKTPKDKAPGPDGIPNRILHRVAGVAPEVLTRIFQACLDQGIHPTRWKEATTVMLRKSGKDDHTNPSAYRPIALLNTLGKALESIVAKRLRYLSEKHSLLPDVQMGARGQRSTDTALDLFTEQVYTIWAGDKPRVASMLSLDVAGAFDNVSHARLIHNLRKRRVPNTLVRWIEDFLRERQTEIRLGNYTLESSRVNAGIPQGSPISPILYLFYNADLLEDCENAGLRTSPIGFVDDVNILTYGLTTQGNCRTLERIHEVCETWAKRHGSKFNPGKYELIHLTRTPKKFDTSASVTINGKEIKPSSNIRILGIRIDPALKWQSQLNAIEAHTTNMLIALKSITGSTWGMSTAAALRVYTSMVRPAITFGANTWYTPTGVQGARKGVAKKLQAIQGKCLRVITGAYRATATEALEIETHTLPMDILLETHVAKTMLRLGESQAKGVVERFIKRIRQQMRSNRGKEAKTRKTLGQRKDEWLKPQIADAVQDETKAPPRAPWKAAAAASASEPALAPRRRRAGRTDGTNRTEVDTGEKRTRKSRKTKIKERAEEEWKKRWRESLKGRELFKLMPEPARENRELHAGRKKAHSALLTQLRTGKIGFSNFLFERRVPGVWSRRCECDEGAMTVRHVLLRCPTWRDIREEELARFQGDIKRILNTGPGATAAIRLVLRTKLLDQFKTTTCETHA